MVLDSSVIIQILYNEPNASKTLALLVQTENLIMAAPSQLEASIVYGSNNGFESDDVKELIERLGITIIPFDAEQAREARLAYARFGKGKHKAKLNFGDTVSYALAKVTGEKLAYVGDDFSQTDIDGVNLG